MRAVVLFLAPALIILVVFSVVPTLAAVVLSFMKWDMLSPMKFNGLRNYSQLLGDTRFTASLVNTIYYVCGFVPLSVIFSLFVALLLNEKWLRGKQVFRVLFFIPVVVSLIAVGMIWKWIYNPAFGLLNQLLAPLGISRQFWTSDPALAIPSLVVMSTWQCFGYNVVIFLAGLLAIPMELYEAAAVDAANAGQRFRLITFPLLAPTTIFVVIISVISSFQVFDQILILGDVGTPPKSLVVTVYYLYEMAFGSFKMGYGATIGIVLFLFILVISILQYRFYAQRFEK